MKRLYRTLLMAVFLSGLCLPAFATIEQGKTYKAAFGEKPKCIHCHVDEKPKKEGDHELNDYGHKVKAAAGEAEPTEDTYKAVGPS